MPTPHWRGSVDTKAVAVGLGDALVQRYVGDGRVRDVDQLGQFARITGAASSASVSRVAVSMNQSRYAAHSC
jgi:hypothetical protein